MSPRNLGSKEKDRVQPNILKYVPQAPPAGSNFATPQRSRLLELDAYLPILRVAEVDRVTIESARAPVQPAPRRRFHN